MPGCANFSRSFTLPLTPILQTAEEPPEGAALDTSEAGLKQASTANAVRDWWIAYNSDKSAALPPAVSQKLLCTGRLPASVLKRCATAVWLDFCH